MDEITEIFKNFMRGKTFKPAYYYNNIGNCIHLYIYIIIYIYRYYVIQVYHGISIFFLVGLIIIIIIKEIKNVSFLSFLMIMKSMKFGKSFKIILES